MLRQMGEYVDILEMPDQENHAEFFFNASYVQRLDNINQTVSRNA
jgi:hypothetical protein